MSMSCFPSVKNNDNKNHIHPDSLFLLGNKQQKNKQTNKNNLTFLSSFMDRKQLTLLWHLTKVKTLQLSDRPLSKLSSILQTHSL